VALGLCACGGVTKFSDTTAITVKSRAPGPGAISMAVAAKIPRVKVMQDRIEITEKIQFDLDQATIKSESHDLLDEITKVFLDNPQITKVDIVGHTSDEGADKYNKTLSEKRAKAVVEYLSSHGVDAARMTSKGMGETRPIADNKTEEGKEMNRRVEFLIVEQKLAAAKEAAK
jgi:OOP family OmpA-OmpF porin